MNKQHRFCERVVSGGQTGVDRAALDFAMEQGYDHGGFCPAGRRAEDGRIPDRYALTELTSAGYRQRTRRNVEEGDGTLILTFWECTGGTLATLHFAHAFGKPCFVVDLAAEASPSPSHDEFLRWVQTHAIARLNVAGPRESKNPGVYEAALGFLRQAHAVASIR